ncbi:MAG TPA: gas vesicle protein [Gemmatimonadaceae bacterium]|nr:gas vesicle protein [Gemmatimonadaceae bacterium]
MSDSEFELAGDERLVLGDLLNHVLDKGVVISGDVTISVADIDLIRVGLNLFITSIQTELQHAVMERPVADADLSVLRDSGGT